MRAMSEHATKQAHTQTMLQQGGHMFSHNGPHEHVRAQSVTGVAWGDGVHDAEREQQQRHRQQDQEHHGTKEDVEHEDEGVERNPV